MTQFLTTLIVAAGFWWLGCMRGRYVASRRQYDLWSSSLDQIERFWKRQEAERERQAKKRERQYESLN